MNDKDKMRAEFEAWAKAAAYDLSQTTDDKYWCVATISAWQVWQAAYAAGQGAEREAIAAEVDEFFNRHHDWRCKLAGVAMAAQIRNKPEGDDERG